MATFTDPPRGGSLLPFGGKRGPESPNTAVSPSSAGASPIVREVYPCVIHHNGRLGGLYTLYAKSSQARLEWKAKLEEAICLRRVAQESNKVFEVETLSVDTFSDPALTVNPGPSWNCDWNFTGKVTCSVPFSKRFRISTVLDTDVPDLQPLLMVMVWQLDVLKECGLGSGMIHGVCVPPALFTPLPHSGRSFSDATSTTSTNGLSMRRT